jgi:hypothetical protein
MTGLGFYFVGWFLTKVKLRFVGWLWVTRRL